MLYLIAFLEHGGPVKVGVVLILHVLEQALEEVLDVLVVGLVLEVEGSAILHVGDEFFREASAEILEVSHDFLLLDFLILLLDTTSTEPLPW